MMKIRYAGSVALSILLLSGCATEKDSPSTDVETPAVNDSETTEEKPVTENPDQPEKDKALSQEEVLAAIKQQLLTTRIEKILPGELPVDNDWHLTATTDSGPDMYQVNFYATKEPVPINNAVLFNDETKKEKMAVLKVKEYTEQEGKADTEVAFEKYSESGGEQVDLGHGITAYQDAGVGNLWTSWNEGRWSLVTHSTTDQPEKGVELAEQTVQYLENNSLPIPKQHGLVRLDATGENHHAIWAKDAILYELSEVRSAEDLLKILATFE